MPTSGAAGKTQMMINCYSEMDPQPIIKTKSSHAVLISIQCGGLRNSDSCLSYLKFILQIELWIIELISFSSALAQF